MPNFATKSRSSFPAVSNSAADDKTIDPPCTDDSSFTDLFECCFTSTETVGLLGSGAQDGYLDFHTAPAL